jgi:anthranilate 1,2-dioxygenase small subunit
MSDILATIIRAQCAYIRCLDTDRLEDWPGFFGDPCLYKITTAANERDGLDGAIIFANSPGMLHDRVSALREANIYERQSYRHILGQPMMLDDRGGTYRCETPFIVARILLDGDTDLFATGVYRDQYVLNGSGAKLRERIVVCDSSRIDTLLAIPL